MYHCKARGGNGVKMYSPQMDPGSAELLFLESDLASAIERNELSIEYQPLLDAASMEIAGAEALVRWEHPKMGLLSPNSFIPVAEENGLIVPLGAWVLRHACLDAGDWQQTFGRSLRLAVNVSSRQLAETDFVDLVQSALDESGLNPEQLDLELTERVLMQQDKQTLDNLEELRSRGVGLSIDDFGMGYSALSYLRRFPLSGIKIDRFFVNGIPGNKDDIAIVRAILAMAAALGMRVVAEGIENQEQLRFLVEEACDEVQGFHLHRPMDQTGFLRLLESERDGKTALLPYRMLQTPAISLVR